MIFDIIHHVMKVGEGLKLRLRYVIVMNHGWLDLWFFGTKKW